MNELDLRAESAAASLLATVLSRTRYPFCPFDQAIHVLGCGEGIPLGGLYTIDTADHGTLDSKSTPSPIRSASRKAELRQGREANFDGLTADHRFGVTVRIRLRTRRR